MNRKELFSIPKRKWDEIGGKRVNRIKYRYNKWLFKKYGMRANIPAIFMLCPLWSPSYYTHAQSEKIVEWFMNGLTSTKDQFSFNISKGE